MAEHEGKTDDGGMMRSPEWSASPSGWSKEEMELAEALPLPTVRGINTSHAAGVPHAGDGKTSAGGPPETPAADGPMP